MNAIEIEILLERIETSLHEQDQLNLFQLLKYGKNVEYAQIQVMHMQDSLPSGQVTKYKHKIGELQAYIAEKQYTLETEAAKQVESESRKTPVSKEVEEKSALATEEHILQNHREAQSSISEDLLLMAQTMKQSQQKFSDSIAADNELIDRTGEALERNSGKMSQTGTRLSKYSRKSSWSWVYTYLAILVAVVAFFITIGLIRVT